LVNLTHRRAFGSDSWIPLGRTVVGAGLVDTASSSIQTAERSKSLYSVPRIELEIVDEFLCLPCGGGAEILLRDDEVGKGLGRRSRFLPFDRTILYWGGVLIHEPLHLKAEPDRSPLEALPELVP
jgi:hypothetical protein